MHKPGNLTIKGFEIAGPEKIRVVTECSGECFEQNVPKRISHHFKYNQKNFYRFEDGEYFFIKKLRKLYTSEKVEKQDYIDELHENKDDVELSDLKNLITQLNNELTDFEI